MRDDSRANFTVQIGAKVRHMKITSALFSKLHYIFTVCYVYIETTACASCFQRELSSRRLFLCIGASRLKWEKWKQTEDCGKRYHSFLSKTETHTHKKTI